MQIDAVLLPTGTIDEMPEVTLGQLKDLFGSIADYQGISSTKSLEIAGP